MDIDPKALATYSEALNHFEGVAQTTTKRYEPHYSESKEQLHDLLDVLRMTGVTGTLEIYFSGGGDQGQVDDVLGGPINDPDVYNEVVLWSEKLTTSTDADWYNNEGGSGQIVIDVDKGTCEYFIDVNTPITTVKENFT